MKYFFKFIIKIHKILFILNFYNIIIFLKKINYAFKFC